MTNRSYAYSRLSNESASVLNRNDSSFEDDSDSSSTKLRRFNSRQKKEHWPGSASHTFELADSQKDHIEHIIKPNETLQGLALQYRCSVFELKLANNIQKEAEFFARRVLRVPVLKHSSLTEKIAQVGNHDLLSPSAETINNSGSDSAEALKTSTEYLKQLDRDLQQLKEKARVYDIDAGSEHTPDGNAVRSGTLRTKRSDCQGDDCGLSWVHILALAMLVLLACPLLYFLYLELSLHSVQSNNRRNLTFEAPLNVSSPT